MNTLLLRHQSYFCHPLHQKEKLYYLKIHQVNHQGQSQRQDYVYQKKPLLFTYPTYSYSGANSCCNKALFMKQKCQIQMDVGQYKNAVTPLRTRGINTTHQHFQMRYITLIYLKGLKSYQPSSSKCVVSVVKQTLCLYFNQ